MYVMHCSKNETTYTFAARIQRGSRWKFMEF